jgi:hypothetical protein
MKSNPTEVPSSGDLPGSLTVVLQKRSRRTLVEAASQFARSMVEGTLGSKLPARGERGAAANSAAASAHRLRKVLARDRATFSAQDTEPPPASVALSEQDEHVTALDAELFGEPARVCQTCGARELPVAGRVQRPRALPRVPPPPPRRAGVVEFVVEDQDEDEWPSVHDEPTRVRPPPGIMDRVDGHASALEAAAASAFGSTSASRS